MQLLNTIAFCALVASVFFNTRAIGSQTKAIENLSKRIDKLKERIG
jgi:hypothetical protein